PLLRGARPGPEAAQPRRPGQDLLRAGGARPLPRGIRRAGRRGRGGGGRPGGRRARPRQRGRGAPRRARRRHASARARMTAPRVALMVTCLGDVFFPEVGVSIVRLLRRLGATVEFPRSEERRVGKECRSRRVLWYEILEER